MPRAGRSIPFDSKDIVVAEAGACASLDYPVPRSAVGGDSPPIEEGKLSIPLIWRARRLLPALLRTRCRFEQVGTSRCP